MSSSAMYQELSNLIKELMMKEGIKEYDLHVKGESEKGGNYLGDVIFFTVVSKDAKIKYNLIMKTGKRSDEVREKIPVGSAYKRESFMYRMVFPAMKNFLKKTGGDVHLDYVPKIYSVCDVNKREALIMENLNFSGYRVCDRTKAMDLNHVLLVMKTFGKHHGISLAMRNKVPEVYKLCTENLTNVFGEFCETEGFTIIHTSIFTNICNLLKKSGLEELANKLEVKIENNVVNILKRDTPIEDRLVICHGDCWNNNILFKYEDSGDPSALCFVDYQQSLLDSPVKDLSFFLYTACDKPVLDNFELLLETYYSSLTDTLEALGCNSSDIFTYSDLKDHWRKYAIFGPLASAFFVKLELLSTEEAPELGKDLQIFSGTEMKNEELYNSRMLDVFTHFGKNFL